MKYLFWLLAVILSACSPAPQSESPPQINLEPLSQLTLTSGTPSYGTVSGSKTVIFSIKNTGDSASEIPTPALAGTSASAFSIIQSTGCTAALPKNGICTVRVNFTSTGKAGGEYLANLKVGTSLTIPLSAAVAMPPVAQYGVFESSTQLSFALGLNFGNLSGSQVMQKILTLKNTGAVATPALALNLTNNSFSLSSNTCENKILQPGQSCSFKLIFSTSGKSPQVYLSDLLFSDQIFPLTGSVTAPLANNDPNSGVIIETYVNNEPLTEADLNLGILPNNQGIVKVLTFKNVGTATSTPMTAALSQNNNFFIISNLCQDKILPPQASCSFRLVFSAISKNAGAYNVALNFGDADLTVGGEVLPGTECPAGTHLEAPTCVSNTQNCPIANGAGQKQWQGTAYGLCSLQSCNSGFEAVNNACVLACAAGEHRNFASLVCEPNVISCVAANAQSAHQTWNGSAYGACTVSSCVSGFEVVDNACVTACAGSEHRNPSSSACEANVIGCAIANGIGSQTWTGAAYGVCGVVSCNAAFHQEANACVNDTRSCVVANGSGHEVWNGAAYNTCIVSACANGFENINNACVANCLASEHRNPSTQVCEGNLISCLAQIPNAQVATQTWNGVAYDSCDLVSCNSLFHEENNACVSDTRACVIANGQGLETWMGSQYSACTAQSCNSAYHLANNQCAADVIDCTASITNAASATQTWNGSAYAACDLQSCVASYHEESNACAHNTRACVIAHGTGAQTWQGSAYGLCLAQSCESGYSIQNNSCELSCTAAQHQNPITLACENNQLACTTADVPFLASGYKQWNGSSYNACVISSCQSGYAISWELDACVQMQMIFSASTAAAGVEPWVTDGTAAGTAMLFNLGSGVNASAFYGLTAIPNTSKIFLMADLFGGVGKEPYVMDRLNPAGVTLLKDINTNASAGTSVAPASLGSPTAVLNGLVFFGATSVNEGTELWVTDGTTIGTRLVKDINPGSSGAGIALLTTMGSRVYFFATDGVRGSELWTSDGTSSGTYLVKDINPTLGSGQSLGSLTYTLNGNAVNGVAGEVPSIFKSNNKLYFWGDDGLTGRELWVSDGTESGTYRLSDIAAGTLHSQNNASMAVVNEGTPQEAILFAANSSTYGTELFAYRPATATVELVKDILPGTGTSGLTNLVSFGNKILFRANDNSGVGDELWTSDGTTAGTVLLKDINPVASVGSTVTNFVKYQGYIYFRANNNTTSPGVGPELWRTDGTTAGTTLFMDLLPGASGSNLVIANDPVNGKLIFQTNNNTNGNQIWASDGTVGGTSVIKTITSTINTYSIFYSGQGYFLYK